jgi:hypothetical protein
MPEPTAHPPTPTWHRAAPALLIAAALAGMVAFTWRTWPDPVIDTGRELYTAWRVSEGDALYRDVAYFNGPLSPHVNALVMSILGPSMDAVAAANAAVLVAATIALHALLRRLSDRFAATAGTLVFVVGFATLRLVGIGNYTYLNPYSHDLTHGLLLTLLTLLCGTNFLRTGSRRRLAAASTCAGLACLTKPETAAAAVIALSTFLAGTILSPLPAPRERARVRASTATLAIALTAFAVPVAIAFALLCLKLTPAEAFAGLTGPFRYALSPAVRDQPFYRQVMLGPDVGESLTIAGLVTLIDVVLVAIGVSAGLAIRKRAVGVLAGVAAFVLVTAALLLLAPAAQAFVLVLRGAPVLLPAIVGVLMWRWWRANATRAEPASHPAGAAESLVGRTFLSASRRGRESSGAATTDSGPSARGGQECPPHEAAAAALARVAFALVAVVLLLKIALQSGPQHYGFVLAVPAAMVITLAGLAWLPAWIESHGGSGWPMRAVTLAVWAAALPMLLVVHARNTAELTRLTFDGTSNSYYARPRTRDEAFELLAALISGRTPPDATLAVVEQGAWLNFVTRRRNPTPFVTILPPEVAMFGEAAIADAFERRPPDHVVRLPFTAKQDYRVEDLADYAPRLDALLRSRYGDAMPPNLRMLPVQLLKRRDESPRP